jgi:Tyrosine phosphatase family
MEDDTLREAEEHNSRVTNADAKRGVNPSVTGLSNAFIDVALHDLPLCACYFNEDRQSALSTTSSESAPISQLHDNTAVQELHGVPKAPRVENSAQKGIHQRLRAPLPERPALRNMIVRESSCLQKLGLCCFHSLLCCCRKPGTKSIVEDILVKLSLVGYYKMVIKHGSAEVSRVLRAAATPYNQPVLFHCSHGKDRTGITAALLLHSVGVDQDTICNDYAMSEEFVNEQDLETLPPGEWRHTRASTMHELFDFIKKEYGSVDDYLDSIGFDIEWRQRLQHEWLKSL